MWLNIKVTQLVTSSFLSTISEEHIVIKKKALEQSSSLRGDVVFKPRGWLCVPLWFPQHGGFCWYQRRAFFRWRSLDSCRCGVLWGIDVLWQHGLGCFSCLQYLPSISPVHCFSYLHSEAPGACICCACSGTPGFLTR